MKTFQTLKQTTCAIWLCSAVVVLWLGVAAAIAAETPESIVTALSARCEPWLGPPSPQLKSLAYTFDLSGDTRRVEIVRGVTKVGGAFWRGISLFTGLEQLLASPASYEMTLEEKAGDYLTLAAKQRDKWFILVAGNGISETWRGYFSAGSDKMTLKLRRADLLPVEETHKGTTFYYKDWLEVGTGKWVPQKIDVVNGNMVFHMQFQWCNGMLWILRRSDYELNGSPTSVAQVKDLVVNDQAIIQRLTKEEEERARQRSLVETMLAHNKPWLQPALTAFESLEYRFRTVREDVDESCYVGKDGLVVLEVTRDGRGKIKDSLGARKIILPSNDYYLSTRGEEWATPQPQEERRRRGSSYQQQLCRYATIGAQFDLPLFVYPQKLEYATIRDTGEKTWDGHRCQVVEVSGVSDAYLGAGTMLGFTSWSYVHHIRPERETFYIDIERHVPLHETLIPSGDSKVYEIDFKDYAEVTPGQWAPLRIELSAQNYFTCHYEFQLVGGNLLPGQAGWMLKNVVSWFDPADKSRGEVMDVRLNEPSKLRDEALAQVDAAKTLLTKSAPTSATLNVATYPFRIGKWTALEAASQDRQKAWTPDGRSQSENYSAIKEVLFTLNDAGDLVARCKFLSKDFYQGFSITINGALYGERGELLAADSLTTSVSLMNKFLVEDFTLNFGQNDSLGAVKHFSVDLIKNAVTSAYHGHSMWMRFLDSAHENEPNAVKRMVWDLADGLTADDPALRSVALKRLFLYSKVAQQSDSRETHRMLEHAREAKSIPSREALFPRDARAELLKPLLWLRERTDDAQERLMIAAALGWFGDPAARPALIDSFEKGSGDERLAAATSLGILGDGRGFNEVVRALKHENAALRRNAVWALGELGDAQSVAALCEALFYQKPWSEPAPHGGSYGHDPFGETRSTILRALLALRNKDSLPALKKLQQEVDAYYLHKSELEPLIQFIEEGPPVPR
jgi:hypothetical protein